MGCFIAISTSNSCKGEIGFGQGRGQVRAFHRKHYPHLFPIFWFCGCNGLVVFVLVVALVLEPLGRF